MEQVLQKNKIDWMIIFSSIIPFLLVFYVSGSAGERAAMGLGGIFFAFISFFILYFKDKLKKQALFFVVLSIWSCPAFVFPSYLFTHNFLTIGMSVLFSGLLCTILFFITAKKILKKR